MPLSSTILSTSTCTAVVTTKEATFRIPDMRCEGCTERVTRVLERLEGIRSAEVSLDGKTAAVVYDERAADVDDMKRAVEKAGYTFASDD